VPCVSNYYAIMLRVCGIIIYAPSSRYNLKLTAAVISLRCIYGNWYGIRYFFGMLPWTILMMSRLFYRENLVT